MIKGIIALICKKTKVFTFCFFYDILRSVLNLDI